MNKRISNKKRLVSIAIAITMCMTALSLTSVADDQKLNVNRLEQRYYSLPINNDKGTILEYHDGTPYYFWNIPDAYGVDFYNERMTMPFDGTLDTAYIVMDLTDSVDVTGEGIDIIVWDDDGFGYPGTELGRVNVLSASILDFDWTEVDLSTLGLSFSMGDEFHVGYTTVNQSAGNIMAVLSDDGDPTPNNLRSSEYYGYWILMVDDWGIDADLFIAAEVTEEGGTWEDCKMHFPQLPDPTGYDVYAEMPDMILADDFECIESGPITDLHFWGSWFEDVMPMEPVPGAPFAFHISFHADIADPDEEGPLYSMPGELLWERDIFDFGTMPMPLSLQGWYEAPGFIIPENHEQWFQYDILFEEPYFEQTVGTIYWVDIAPIQDAPGMFWGWKTSLDHFMDDSVFSIPASGPETLLSENFDGYDPGTPPGPSPFPLDPMCALSWQIFNNDGDSKAWAIDTINHNTGSYGVSVGYNSAGQDDWLITPYDPITPGPCGLVHDSGTYDFYAKSTSGTYLDDFEVLVWDWMTNGPVVCTPPYTGWQSLGTVFSVPNAWTPYSFVLPGTTHPISIAIRCISVDELKLAVDDVNMPATGFATSFEGTGGTPESGWPPAVWTTTPVSGTYDWKINDTATHPTGIIPYSGGYMAEFDCYSISSGNSAILSTPSLDFSGTGHELTFFMNHDSGYPSNFDNLTVQVSTDGSIWTDIIEFTRYDINDPGWVLHTVDLSSYDGEPIVYVGFLGVSDYGNSLYIDDVEITNAGGGSAGWGEMIIEFPPYSEHVDLAFVITGEEMPDTPPTACYTWVDADGSGPGTTIDFDAGCSTDDFGITMYEWDWTNDGIYDYTGGPTASYDYGDTDPHDCTIRVTDTISQTNIFTDTVQAQSLVEILDVEQTVQDRGFPVRHALDGDWGASQNFTPTIDSVTKVEIYLRTFGTPEFDLVVELRTDGPEGTLLDTVSFTPGEVPSSWTWFEVDFDDTTVGIGSDVFIVVPPAPSGVTTSFGYEWGYAFGNQYDGGSFWFTRDGGGLWRDLPTMYEFVFKTYGFGVYVDQPPTACYTWDDADGSGAGTMINFDASCSSDYEGIVLYEWDWDNDATYDATGITQSYDFGDTAPHTVGLRVTDTIAQTDIVTDTVQASAGSVVLLTEDFEGGVIPTGWTLTSYDTVTWEVNTDMVGNGTYSARVWWSDYEQDEWLITPSVDLSSGSGTLEFLSRFMGDNYPGSDWEEHDQIEISTDGGTVWTIINDLPIDYPDFDWDSEIWETFTIDLSPYLSSGDNDVVFAFHRVTPDGGSATWGIDDVIVSS